MKLPLLAFLALFALSLAAPALEKREFWNADKTKSFQATLVDYATKTKTVTVRKPGGREINFKIDTLSEEDQEYIKEKAPILAAARGITTSISDFTGDKTHSKGKTIRLTTTQAGYNITLTNRSQKIENITVRYTIFYKKDKEKGASDIVKKQGSYDISTLFRNEQDTRQTETVSLERYIRKPSGGG